MLKKLWWFLIGEGMRKVVTDYRAGKGRLYLFDPITATVVAASVLGGAGVGLGAYAMASEPKMPEPPKAPDQPTPEDAKKKAQDAQTARRKTLLATGGQTDITQGQATLLGANVQNKSLLGG